MDDSKKSNKIVLYGCGGHARSIVNVLLKNKEKNDILLVDSNAGQNEIIMGCRTVKEYYLNKDDVYIVAIGNNEQRKKLFDFLSKQSIQNCISVVSANAELGIGTEIGKGSFIASCAYVGPYVMIGNNVIINTGSIIEHETIIGNHTHIAPNVTICGRVKVGNNVFCGAGSTVIDGITICDNVVIGAGAVVVRDIDVAGVYVGVPLKKIR